MQDESGATAVSAVQVGSRATNHSPVRAAFAHDAALASWLWAYQWEQTGPRKPSAKKDPTAVAAVDRVLAADWV